MQTPRIDVVDSSSGALPPVFALKPAVNALGSSFLYFNHGAGFVGVYSLVTGQLMKEITLKGSPSDAPLTGLQLCTLSSRHGVTAQVGRQVRLYF